MNPGKAAAQAGHAFVEALLACQQQNLTRYRDYRELGLGTKICLRAKTLADLEAIQAECRRRQIPAKLITDSGCVNFFAGRPTVTALGVGPAKKSELHHVLGRLPLL